VAVAVKNQQLPLEEVEVMVVEVMVEVGTVHLEQQTPEVGEEVRVILLMAIHVQAVMAALAWS